mmetsp:Transcript_23537/g.30528  ORF Transcript_23537/g.30528 Transcript_23537/m.30528 type:complete len:228 (-) Transcript_23537:262-945(-)
MCLNGIKSFSFCTNSFAVSSFLAKLSDLSCILPGDLEVLDFGVPAPDSTCSQELSSDLEGRWPASASLLKAESLCSSSCANASSFRFSVSSRALKSKISGEIDSNRWNTCNPCIKAYTKVLFPWYWYMIKLSMTTSRHNRVSILTALFRTNFSPEKNSTKVKSFMLETLLIEFMNGVTLHSMTIMCRYRGSISVLLFIRILWKVRSRRSQWLPVNEGIGSTMLGCGM